VTTATSGVLARFPLLLPVRNSFASYGASAVARTSDRGHVAEASNQGHRSGGVSIRVSEETFLPLNVHRFSVSSIKMLKTVHQRCVMRMRMNTIDVRMRLGDAIDPFQLANGFEAVILPLSITDSVTSHMWARVVNKNPVQTSPPSSSTKCANMLSAKMAPHVHLRPDIRLASRRVQSTPSIPHDHCPESG
jgi:hypothetical protein